MKKPFVFINSAMSLDGKISISAGNQIRISNEEDMRRVDKLRAESDAIVVGSNTVAIDDPKLTVKSDVLRKERIARGFSENPIKVMVGSLKEIKLDSDFLNYGNAEKIIFTTERDDPKRVRDLTENAKVFVLGKEKVDLKGMIRILGNLGVTRIMVEGGGTLNFEMLKEGVVDEIYVAVAPKIFGGRNATTLADGEGFMEHDIINLELIDIQKLGKMLILRYRAIS